MINKTNVQLELSLESPSDRDSVPEKSNIISIDFSNSRHHKRAAFNIEDIRKSIVRKAEHLF